MSADTKPEQGRVMVGVETVEDLAAEKGWPPYGLNGSPLVRCSCGAIHYCAPSDSDRGGRLCSRCAATGGRP